MVKRQKFPRHFLALPLQNRIPPIDKIDAFEIEKASCGHSVSDSGWYQCKWKSIGCWLFHFAKRLTFPPAKHIFSIPVKQMKISICVRLNLHSLVLKTVIFEPRVLLRCVQLLRELFSKLDFQYEHRSVSKNRILQNVGNTQNRAISEGLETLKPMRPITRP